MRKTGKEENENKRIGYCDECGIQKEAKEAKNKPHISFDILQICISSEGDLIFRFKFKVYDYIIRDIISASDLIIYISASRTIVIERQLRKTPADKLIAIRYECRNIE